MANPIVEPGHWYWGVDCQRCSRPIPLMEDLSAANVAPITWEPGGGRLEVRCPYPSCGHTAVYHGGSVRRFQAQHTQ
jgi:hypothetical protein